MNISRTDEMTPVYGIMMAALLYHPTDEVLSAMFDPTLVSSINNGSNETSTALTLPQLNYSNIEEPSEESVESGDQSTLLFSFNGTVAGLADTVPYIQLHGHIDYETAPSNGHQYRDGFTFPEIFLRHHSL